MVIALSVRKQITIDMAGFQIGNLIGALVFIIVAVALIPTIQESATNANLTGTTATIIALVPLLFSVGVLVVVVKGMIGGK